MKVTAAEFVISAASPRQFPSSVLPEVAFAGKSNVGKSSLINAILGRKHLVKTSSAPGKTRQINFFRVNDRFHFVDLPGYGFARAPRDVQEQWERLVSTYLLQRPVLKGVVVILDVRHEPGSLDHQMKTWMDQTGLPVLYVANKVDKLARSRVASHCRMLAEALDLPEMPLAFSARTGQGKAELWQRLGVWLDAQAGRQQGSI